MQGHYPNDEGYDLYSSSMYDIYSSDYPHQSSEWDGGWGGQSDLAGGQYYPEEDYNGQPAPPPPALAPPLAPHPHPPHPPPAPLHGAGAGVGGQKDFRWMPKRGWVVSPHGSNMFYNILEVLAMVIFLALIVFAPVTLISNFGDNDESDTGSSYHSFATLIALSVFPVWLALVITGAFSKRRKFGNISMNPREADELMARLRAEYIYIDCHATNSVHTYDSKGHRTTMVTSRFKETVPYSHAEDHSPPSLSDISQGGSLEVRIKEDWQMVDPGTHQVYLAAKQRVMQRGYEQVGETKYSETTHMESKYPKYFTITPDGRASCLSSSSTQILLILLGFHGIARIYTRKNHSRAEVVVFKTIYA